MSDILVLTEPSDFHAFAVAEVLGRWGFEPALWFGSDFPEQQSASVWNRNDEIKLELCGLDLDIRDHDFLAVWNRRPTLPVLQADLHPADREPAVQDCQHFVWSLWHLIAPSAVWVNPLASVHSSTLKPLQLRWAADIGLEIPPSLCSNDPRRIREFLRAHRSSGAIFKAFIQGSWKTEEGVAAVFTRHVTEEDLPEDEMIRVSPGIFQALIPKHSELRVTFLGDHGVAARLRPQEGSRSSVDWRRGYSELAVEPAELPRDVSRKCQALMQRFQLAFAVFDLIVTPDGRHVFLEMNPMGQFLFIEHLCPAISILDLFCRFLLKRAGLAPPGGARRVRLDEIWSAAEERLLAAAKVHMARTSSRIDETEASALC